MAQAAWDVKESNGSATEPQSDASIRREYAAAHEGAVLFAWAPGLLRLTGSTRLDFLHRMSTNDLQ